MVTYEVEDEGCLTYQEGLRTYQEEEEGWLPTCRLCHSFGIAKRLHAGFGIALA
jgi:hypothetical protein